MSDWKSLRLILWDDCNRECARCPNHGTEDAEILDLGDLGGYDEILLTGGEPMLYPRQLRLAVYQLREYNPDAKIYVYTAMPYPLPWFIDVMGAVDGVTLTVYNTADFENAKLATAAMMDHQVAGKSNRLNMFRSFELPSWMSKWWNVNEKVFIEDCPLPAHETLRRWGGRR
jgi:hypothetical protein